MTQSKQSINNSIFMLEDVTTSRDPVRAHMFLVAFSYSYYLSLANPSNVSPQYTSNNSALCAYMCPMANEQTSKNYWYIYKRAINTSKPPISDRIGPVLDRSLPTTLLNPCSTVCICTYVICPIAIAVANPLIKYLADSCGRAYAPWLVPCHSYIHC